MPPPQLRYVDHVRDIAGRYSCLLCDIWGVVHDGLKADFTAVAALQEFRKTGGRVVLITNSPRPAPGVIIQLGDLDVPADSYDAVVTSGDVTRQLLSERLAKKIWHLGPERDVGVYAGIDINLVARNDADVILCTGLFDDTTETPEDYQDVLTQCAGSGMEMICGNPDLVVKRGDDLIFCAGALAKLYEELGGAVVCAGKPWRPIYDMALAAASNVEPSKVLAIGDSIRTDMTGAVKNGLDALFIEGAISKTEGGAADAISQKLATAGIAPVAIQKQLVW